MSKPITLWQPNRVVTSDEACTTILKYSCSAPRQTAPPYEIAQTLQAPAAYLPSLKSMCISTLMQYPNQLHVLGSTRLIYEPPEEAGDYDLLQELIPAYTDDCELSDAQLLRLVDPRLWATLIQIYRDLPDMFHVYNVPLSDPHVPLLQEIPSTSNFCLVTVLDLCGCGEITDETVLPLRELHNLTALNLSATAVGSWGIRKLAKSLVKRNADDADADTRPLAGPWGLRVLHLNRCSKVRDDVYASLAQFPLLCVVGEWHGSLARDFLDAFLDLRGTGCAKSSYVNSSFQLSMNQKLFFPTPLMDVLSELANTAHNPNNSSMEDPLPSLVYSCPDPYFLNITSLLHTHRGHITRPNMSSRRALNVPRPEDLPRFQRRVHDDASSTDDSDTSLDALNAVAATEALRHASESATAAFYAPPVPSRKRPRSLLPHDLRALTAQISPSSVGSVTDPPLPNHLKASDVARRQSWTPTRHRPTFGEVENLGRIRPPPPGLMLFRAPPPWSVLASVENDARCERTAPKRSRTESDERPMASRTLVESRQAQQSVRAMAGLLMQRTSKIPMGGPTARTEDKKRQSNPFSRRKSDFAEPSVPAPTTPAAPTPRTKKRKTSPQSNEEEVPEPEAPKPKSTLPKFPPNTKPLVPAMSLPVPPKEAFFPHLAKNKGKEKQRSSPSTKQTPTSAVQTRLVKIVGTPVHDPQARVKPSPLGSSTKTGGEDRGTPTNSKPRAEGSVVRKKRKSSGGGAFDWQKWRQS